MTSAALPVTPEARPFVPFVGGRRAIVLGLALGVIGTVLLIIGGIGDPVQALSSYLVAYAYLFTLTVGAVAFVTSMHAANAVWVTVVRRCGEAVMALLPLVAVLVVPIFVGAGHLYPWRHPDSIADGELRKAVLHLRPYLNLPLVVARAVLCFGFFLAVAVPLRRWSLRMDTEAPAAELLALRVRMRRVGGGALPGLGVLGTLVAWDWLMSLTPPYASTMFGLYFLSSGFVTALAIISLCAVLARRGGYLPGLRESHFYALGRLMFAFTIFWAYTAYFQYFLTWIANRPPEAAWFLRRTTGGYAKVALFIVFGTFGLPFVVLASYWFKRRAWGISASAIWIAVSHYFDVHWIVAAARGRANPFSWMDAAAAAAVLGFSLAFGVWRQQGRLLAPIHDPTFVRALEYDSQ
jgi:hypothetical protein